MKILVVGATNIDIISKSFNQIALYDKNPGLTKISYGGVARNICENLARLNLDVTFYSVIGNDSFGKDALNFLENIGVKTRYTKLDYPTGTFLSILSPNNDNYISISSMEILDNFNENELDSINFEEYDIVVSDANKHNIANYLGDHASKLFIDATSEAKCRNISKILDKISYLKCTSGELVQIFGTDVLEDILVRYSNISVVVTNKSESIIYNIGHDIYRYDIEYVAPVSTIGAGDSFSAGIVYGLSKNYDMHKCIEIAAKIACNTLLVEEAVNPNLSEEIIKESL